MSSDDYHVQNMYRYARKSYKKNCRKGPHENGGFSPQDDANAESDHSPRYEGLTMDCVPSCSFDVENEEVASILHKKCAVITLARQQLKRLLDDTDKVLCDNSKCCRSIYDFLCICRQLFHGQNKYVFMLLFSTALAFFFGLIFGAASCGSYLGQFNSPIMTCLDNFFISDKFTNIEEYRGIV